MRTEKKHLGADAAEVDAAGSIDTAAAPHVALNKEQLAALGMVTPLETVARLRSIRVNLDAWTHLLASQQWAVIDAVDQLELLEWQPITNPDRGLFLVTNNMDGRDAHGYMSHVWITTGIHVGHRPGDGQWFCLTDGSPLRVVGLTHFRNITPLIGTGNHSRS